MKDKYKKYLSSQPFGDACPLCSKEAIKYFMCWKIVINDFPYDVIAASHHVLVPLRHVKGGGLSAVEKEELELIKAKYVDERYDYMIEATTKNKSIPDHFHVHLIVGK